MYKIDTTSYRSTCKPYILLMKRDGAWEAMHGAFPGTYFDLGEAMESYEGIVWEVAEQQITFSSGLVVRVSMLTTYTQAEKEWTWMIVAGWPTPLPPHSGVRYDSADAALVAALATIIEVVSSGQY